MLRVGKAIPFFLTFGLSKISRKLKNILWILEVVVCFSMLRLYNLFTLYNPQNHSYPFHISLHFLFSSLNLKFLHCHVLSSDFFRTLLVQICLIIHFIPCIFLFCCYSSNYRIWERTIPHVFRFYNSNTYHGMHSNSITLNLEYCRLILWLFFFAKFIDWFMFWFYNSNMHHGKEGN